MGGATLPREHALALLRLVPEQQIALAEEVMEEWLTTPPARNLSKGMIASPLYRSKKARAMLSYMYL